MFKVLNSSPIVRHVKVLDLNTNKPDTVNLQPYSRVDLPENLMVDPTYETQNPDIKVHEV